MNVKLLTPHTHAGKDYKAGETIENVDEQTAEFMRTRGIIAAVPQKTPKDEKK